MLYGLDYTKAANGIIRTNSLFYELSYTDTTAVIFTLKDEDIEVNGKTYVSLSSLYRSMVPHDPTEYEFSQEIFGYWDVWESIKNSTLLKPHVDRWRKEVEVKVKSAAIRAIAKEMTTEGKNSFQAAKLLLDRGWLDQETTSKAKAKLKQKEEEELNKAAMAQVSDDAERLGLKRVN